MNVTARLLATAALGVLAIQAPALAQRAAPLPNAASPEAEGFSSERLKRLDAAMAQAVADQKVAGMLTLLARDGKVVAFHSYGDAAPGRPMHRDAIFRIYSMTKVVTGVGMMMLFEEGKWRMDDPVTKFVPEFARLKVATGVDKDGKIILAPMKRPPTMREVMSHTGGFGYGFTPLPADKIFTEKGVMQANGLQDMIDRLVDVPLHSQPGERWNYSISVDIQGYIIEKLTGQKLSDFFRQRIFAPLKMVDTGFYVPKEKLGRVASVYTNDPQTGRLSPGGSLGAVPLSSPDAPPALEMGGAGLLSTIDDYSRFAQMLANKGELDGTRLLAPATVEVMQANVIPEAALKNPTAIGSFNENVGFGMDVQTITNPRAAGRLEGKGTMSWEGAAGTWFWTDPANDVIFVGMVQNFARAGPNGFDPVSRPLVYQALVEPSE